jgi:hypothetical protein
MRMRLKFLVGLVSSALVAAALPSCAFADGPDVVGARGVARSTGKILDSKADPAGTGREPAHRKTARADAARPPEGAGRG